MVVRSDQTPELVFEFKFHRAPPRSVSARPVNAEQMFKDIFRLAGYRASRPDSRCFFVYCMDREMKAYLGNPRNNLADFFNLSSRTMDIDEGYLDRHSETMRKYSKTIRPCRIAARLRRDLANDFAVSTFEVLG